jgi:glycerol-3-phosphate O-acyltransferase
MMVKNFQWYKSSRNHIASSHCKKKNLPNPNSYILIDFLEEEVKIFQRTSRTKIKCRRKEECKIDFIAKKTTGLGKTAKE